MALGPNSRRASRHTTLLYPEERSSRVAINAENSTLVESFRRDRANVRPYVRTSTQKLKWTHELHQCFMRAVDHLGGQDKATPKKILQHMKRDGITIAHIKSHLQMFRSGKINADGLSKSDYKSWQGGQWQSSNAGPQAAPINSSEPAQSKSTFEELSRNLEFEPAMALIQLKEDSGRSSDSGAAALELPRGSPDNQPYLHKKFKAIMQMEDVLASGSRGIVPVVELNDSYLQNSANIEQELHQHDFGQSSTYRPNPWPSPNDEASTDNPVDVTDALSGSKRKAEEAIELTLTMATRSLRPSFQFACPPTAEEASILSLGLS